MKLIFGKRATGKTIQAIMTSATTGSTILVADERRKEYIKKEAKRINRNIPTPLTINDLRRTHVKPILIIDDLEKILEGILERDLECRVLAAFMNAEEVIEKISEEPEEKSEDEE